MPRFRVRDGERVGHAGEVHGAGKIIELPRHIAEDQAVRGALIEVDEKGQPLGGPAAEELTGAALHARVEQLRLDVDAGEKALSEKKARLAQLDAQLLAEVKAKSKPSGASAPSA